jgi:hypothetical protein
MSARHLRALSSRPGDDQRKSDTAFPATQKFVILSEDTPISSQVQESKNLLFLPLKLPVTIISKKPSQPRTAPPDFRIS